MMFDWLDYFSIAEALHSDPEIFNLPEATLRSAASRAYYGAFHYAQNFARREGFIPSGSGDDHMRIQRYFRDSNTPNETRRKIALELNRLYDKRRVADYRSELTSQPQIFAELAIGLARAIIGNLNSLTTN